MCGFAAASHLRRRRQTAHCTSGSYTFHAQIMSRSGTLLVKIRPLASLKAANHSSPRLIFLKQRITQRAGVLAREAIVFGLGDGMYVCDHPNGRSVWQVS